MDPSQAPVTDEPDYDLDGSFGGPILLSVRSWKFALSGQLQGRKRNAADSAQRADYKDYVFHLK